ncbi:hypothetical protein AWH62_03100 [Maricaulis sp. W15]|uniref:Hint domain-containing protein n=1 Tax=Maricaulis sp. W15 TaxID=1772333 RepID=UPI000948CBA5|nr:Hint domain-containing protein [Maricaulis sp. W15]OLF77676.1 hypothetical protein AWH62_03100 [Maricaulis sp. W15]
MIRSFLQRGAVLSTALSALSLALAAVSGASGQGGDGAPNGENFADIFEGVRNLQPIPLDMSNERHRAYFLEQQRLAGLTPDNSDHLAHFMELAQAYHGSVGMPSAGRVTLTSEGERFDPDTGEATDNAVGPVHTITSFQQDQANPLTYRASALASIADQPPTCTHTLIVTDQDGNPQGNGTSLVQQFACEAVHLSAQGTLDESDAWAGTQMTYYWIDQSGTPHSGTLRAAGSTIPTSIVSTDPADKNGDGMIKFCFGRQAADCDYQPSGASASNVFLPIVGYATYDTAIIDPSTDAEASVYIAISHPEPEAGGGCTLQGDTSTFLQDYVTLSNGDMQVNWNDPTTHFPAIDSSCMPHGSIVYYTMTMNIDLTSGGNTIPVFFGVSSSPETPVSTGRWYQLPSTRIYYSCVAAGTQVTLANGESRAVETLDITDRIASNEDGDAMTVYSVYSGEEETMVRLVTVSGRELLITESHPVVLTTGIVLAGEIRPGQSVRTVDGPEAVLSADRVAYNGPVHNLSVGTEADGIALTSHNTTFFANGVLIGDNEMQWTFSSERRRDILAERGEVEAETVRQGILR